MDQETRDQLLLAREDLGIGGYQPALKSYQGCIDEALEPFRTNLLLPAECRSEEFISSLKEVTERLHTKRKLVRPRTFVYAYLYDKLEREFEEYALVTLTPPNLSIPSFVLLMDMSFGVSLITTSLKLGINDSNSFFLADRVVPGLSGEGELPLSIPKPSFQIPEFVLAGADFARRLCKVMRPIAVDLFPQGSS